MRQISAILNQAASRIIEEHIDAPFVALMGQKSDFLMQMVEGYRSPFVPPPDSEEGFKMIHALFDRFNRDRLDMWESMNRAADPRHWSGKKKILWWL